MEMEIGNGNIKVAGLLAALIDLCVVAGLLFVYMYKTRTQLLNL